MHRSVTGLCSMVTMATFEMPHSALVFSEVCLHIQSHINSVFDNVTILRNISQYKQNQDLFETSFYDVSALDIRTMSK